MPADEFARISKPSVRSSLVVFGESKSKLSTEDSFQPKTANLAESPRRFPVDGGRFSLLIDENFREQGVAKIAEEIGVSVKAIDDWITT